MFIIAFIAFIKSTFRMLSFHYTEQTLITYITELNYLTILSV